MLRMYAGKDPKRLHDKAVGTRFLGLGVESNKNKSIIVPVVQNIQSSPLHHDL